MHSPHGDRERDDAAEIADLFNARATMPPAASSKRKGGSMFLRILGYMFILAGIPLGILFCVPIP